MYSIEKLINQFNPISLSDMDGVKLLNRVDTKFVCTVYELAEILNDLSKTYKVLEIDTNRIMSYKTKYYDTSDFLMYYNHQNGKLNRYKVREREYVDTNVKFLEVKFKNNKKRTIKSRIEKEFERNGFTNKELSFLYTKSPISPDQLEPKLYNNFNRITLTNNKERVTIDFNLEFSKDKSCKGCLPFLAIIEVKQSKFSINSDIVKVLREHHLRPTGFSKYCIGSTLVYPELKSNIFKSKLLLIKNMTA